MSRACTLQSYFLLAHCIVKLVQSKDVILHRYSNTSSLHSHLHGCHPASDCFSLKRMLSRRFTCDGKEKFLDKIRGKASPLCLHVILRARCSISAEFSTEPTGSHAPNQQHNTWLTFKIKRSKISENGKKIQALLLIFSVRNASCCSVYNTYL